MKSLLKEIGPVQFPANTGERVYMLPFTKRNGLPKSLSRWQDTVDAMLRNVDSKDQIYLMIDQGVVKAGHTHRRSGPHIDGNWIPAINSHGTGDGGGGRHCPVPKHMHVDLEPEGLILASDVCASCAYLGEIEGIPGEGGDCSHLDLTHAQRIPLQAGLAYAGNVTMVHESLPVESDCQRTLVRLNVPGWVF